MFKQKNGKNPTAFEDIFTKNESKYNTRTSLSLFQRNVLAQYVSKLFHTVVQHIGIAFLSTQEIRNKVFDLLLLTLINIS